MLQIVIQNKVGRTVSIGRQAHRDTAWHKKVYKKFIRNNAVKIQSSLVTMRYD